jgi:hypothetical protein
MEENRKHSIRIGEYKLFGIASHIVITGHDETGAQIWEINGLATDKDNEPKAIGMPWDSSDTIKGHPTNYPVMGDKVVNQVPIVIGTAEEISAYKARADIVIDRVNARNLDYKIDVQNSNSFAGTILKAFGIPPQELLNSPKHRFEKPVPGFVTDLLDGADDVSVESERDESTDTGGIRQRKGVSDLERVPVPKPDPKSADQLDIPLSDKPIVPGASSILPPFFTPVPRASTSTGKAEFKRTPNENRTMRQTGLSDSANPFSITKPRLKQQAEMLERNPVMAKRMILAADRDPKLFGLT